jgi:hypothetical protein
VVLLGALPCAAQVEDEAGLFKPETIAKANSLIEKIRETTGKQIAVYTVKKAPEDLAKEYNLDDAGQRGELFDKWARERMKEKKIDGVQILLCQEPPHIEITVSKGSESLFGPWYRNHLKGRMIGRFQPDNPDQTYLQALRNKLRPGPRPDTGLLEAITYVGDKLDYNRPVDQTNLYLSLAILGVMLGATGLLGFVRLQLRKHTPDDAGVHDADDSGRSIAVLGGGIGAVCGQWLYYRFIAPRPPAEPAPAPARETRHDGPSEESQGPDALPGEH